MKKQTKHHTTRTDIKKRQHDDFSDILHAVLLMHTRSPDWRFGQCVANVIRNLDGRINCDPFHVDDKDFLESVRSMIK
jgi:hypothetical protein